MDIILFRRAEEIVKQHPKIGQQHQETQDIYSKHVLIPEACERYLMKKFDMDETEAKKWYKNHRTYTCDFENCGILFNDQDTMGQHKEDVHKDEIEEIEAKIQKKIQQEKTTANQKAHQAAKEANDRQKMDENNPGDSDFETLDLDEVRF